MKYLVTLITFLTLFVGIEYRIIVHEADEIDSLNYQLGALQHDMDACRAELNAGLPTN